MSTAEILESITDRSKFERLATSVLRKTDPSYFGIIHTGVNAQGETIVAPIDGLHLIPGSNPPHYIFVQHTTTDRDRLRGKWLSNHDADLTKASREAKSVRKKQTNAIFTVVLTSNQRVDPQLALDVYEQSNSEGLSLDIWELSRFSDFLDTTADGQWLRRQYLGIEAESLSEDLLMHICRRSIELHQKNILQPEHCTLVHRNVVANIVSSALPGGPGVCLIEGHSGYGKSVAANQALNELMYQGYLGLWLPAQYMVDEFSLETALNSWLQVLHPMIQPDAGRAAVELAGKSGRLVICIDDINRTPEAIRLLRHALHNSSPSKNSVGELQKRNEKLMVTNTICQIIPVWPEQLVLLPNKLLENSGVQIHSLGKLSIDEATALICRKLPDLSTTEGEDLAKRLSYDPYLVGLFISIADEGSHAQLLKVVAEDVIGHFVGVQFREVSATMEQDILPSELQSSLTSVARAMLGKRNLQPTWQLLQEWLHDEPRVLFALRLLIKHKEICWLDSDDKLTFRHDRLQECFLVDAMKELLCLSSPVDVLFDPFFSVLVGMALAQTNVTIDRITELRNTAPWVIYEAIRHFAVPLNELHERIYQEALLWATENSSDAPESVITAISWTLLETNNSIVLSIIDAMKPSPLLMLAGLKNGSAIHGLRYFRYYMKHDFEPAYRNSLRDRIVQHAVHRYRQPISHKLHDHLAIAAADPLDANSYLALLGHMELKGFDEQIHDIWNRHGDEVLAYAIWAAARCISVVAENVLGPLIKRLAELPSPESGRAQPYDGGWMALYLGWAFRGGITHDALTYLLASGKISKIFQRTVALMIEQIDHPDAIEYLVRHLADGGGSNSWSHLTGIGDGDPEIRLRSADTSNRLFELWQSQDESDEIRTNSFCLWLQTTGCNNAAHLASVDSKYSFFRFAIQHRIKLGDLTAVSELIDLLQSDDFAGWWWTIAHRVWCQQLQNVVSQSLDLLKASITHSFSNERSDRTLFFAQLLTKIPVSNAEDLLQKHWNHLKFCPCMIHAAFRIGTNRCVSLAKDALSQCPVEIDIFELAFTSIWDQVNSANPITLQHLRNLEPFLSRITESEILFLAWETERSIGDNLSMASWIRTHVVPKLPYEDQMRVRSADQMLIGNLDRVFEEKRFKPYLSYLFDERGGKLLNLQERQRQIIHDWLSLHRNVRGLQVVADCLNSIGIRQDLELLDEYQFDGNSREIEQIKANLKFTIRKRMLA